MSNWVIAVTYEIWTLLIKNGIRGNNWQEITKLLTISSFYTYCPYKNCVNTYTYIYTCMYIYISKFIWRYTLSVSQFLNCGNTLGEFYTAKVFKVALLAEQQRSKLILVHRGGCRCPQNKLQILDIRPNVIIYINIKSRYVCTTLAMFSLYICTCIYLYTYTRNSYR